MDLYSQQLTKSIQYVKGVGPRLAQVLSQLDIKTVNDFLFFFPRTYEDRRILTPIQKLKLNEINLFSGKITHIYEEKIKNRFSIIKAILSDQTGNIVAVWFNQPYLLKTLLPGVTIIVKGKFEPNKYTKENQILVSAHEILHEESAALQTGCIVPIYPLIAGLNNITLRKISSQLIEDFLSLVEDPMPDTIRKEAALLDLQTAVREIHFPSNQERFKQARYRLVFDEFFYLQLSLVMRKEVLLHKIKGTPLTTEGDLTQIYLSRLPYQFTSAQIRAISEIKKDLDGPYAMNRLIQGDVGSGKTDVALMALLFAIQSGYKGAIMAPTEILCSQLYLKFKRIFQQFDIPVYLLKGKMKAKERKEMISQIEKDNKMVIVGTHALIVDKVEIPNLSMIIIDEQHRFGVLQRLKLKEKGSNPHCLFMTATPIPRSLTLTCFGDLDKSIIDELPPGRIPIQTHFMKANKIEKVYQFCHSQIKAGRQIYIVYPLVEESEKMDLESAIKGWEHVKENVFPQYQVGLLHGRMTPDEKQIVMEQFKDNTVQILVSTTVIEVGIDVPNASAMIIHHAERFGLSQLHQLRGRIGRGEHQSHCFLISEPKTKQAKARIKAMLETSDGFKIAEFDLKIRGPGDLLGTRQSGLPDLKLADLIKDEKILLMARLAAFSVIKKDPELKQPQNAVLKQTLLKRHHFNYLNRLN